MDAFDREARKMVDDLIALVNSGAKREAIVESLAVGMRSANHHWCRDQAMAPAKQAEQGEDHAE